jgi:excisionase family DNA binding protein
MREATRPRGAAANRASAEFRQGDDNKAASPTIDRQTLTVEEAATLLGIGRNSAYQAIARGELPALRIGRRLLVPRAALERHLAESGAIGREAPGRRRS